MLNVTVPLLENCTSVVAEIITAKTYSLKVIYVILHMNGFIFNPV
jgi:hypothetical protein